MITQSLERIADCRSKRVGSLILSLILGVLWSILLHSILGTVVIFFAPRGAYMPAEADARTVVMGANTGLTAMTNDGGTHVLGPSGVPVLLVTIESPPIHVMTQTSPVSVPGADAYKTDDGGYERVYLPTVINCHSTWCSSDIVNGGFELGWAGWMHGGELNQSISSNNPHSANYSALLGDPRYECSTGVPVGSAWIERTVLVPCAGCPKLSFWYSITTYDINNSLGKSYDLFDATVNDSQVFRDMPPATYYGCQDPPKTTGWVSRTIDLSDYMGSCITIRFANWNRPDSKYNTWTYVDDVRIDP